jgi:cytochrome c551/c552|tara:strand:- start:39 stop:185 length:147 start_codon:yes stop_codon:yes gene_type:complete
MTKRTHQRKMKSTKGNWKSTPMQQQTIPSKEELEELIRQQQDPRHNQD